MGAHKRRDREEGLSKSLKKREDRYARVGIGQTAWRKGATRPLEGGICTGEETKISREKGISYVNVDKTFSDARKASV